MPTTSGEKLTSILSQDETEKQYNVIMHNDEVTLIEAVIMILVLVFDYNETEAIRKAYEINDSDCGIVGTYDMEEAYKRVDMADEAKQAMEAALCHPCPLLLTVEEN